MMINSYLSIILWTLFYFLKHVITEHTIVTIPYHVYHNYLFVDIFVCPSWCMWSTFIWCENNYIHDDGSKQTGVKQNKKKNFSWTSYDTR